MLCHPPIISCLSLLDSYMRLLATLGPLVRHLRTPARVVVYVFENSFLSGGLSGPDSASRLSVISPRSTTNRHQTSSLIPDIFPSPPSHRRSRGRPSTHRTLSLRPSITTRRTQTTYTHAQGAHAPGQDPAKTSHYDEAFSYSYRAARAVGARKSNSNPPNNAFYTGTNTTVTAPSGACRRTR